MWVSVAVVLVQCSCGDKFIVELRPDVKDIEKSK
jgi:hypothetical protein